MPGRLRDPGPGAKDALDEALRGEDSSKQTADYGDWAVADLRHRAAELGIEGRASMRRQELIDALRTR